jgi:hypothetical protein
MPDDQHELPQGAMTPADLDQGEEAGVFSVIRPGESATADDFDAETITELEAYDAELLALEGPDAWTSDRARRLLEFKVAQVVEREAALRHAEQDSDRVGYVLATFRTQRGWSREQLADWLGIEPDELVRLAAKVRPAAVSSITMLFDPEPIDELADRHGTHRERLYEAFDRDDP